MNIDDKNLEAIVLFTEAVSAIAKGGDSFKKKLAELKGSVDEFNAAKADFDEAKAAATRRVEAANTAEQRLDSKTTRAKAVLDNAAVEKQAQKAENQRLITVANNLTQREEALAADQNAFSTWRRKTEAELREREEAVAEAEAKVQRVLDAAAE